MSLVGCSTTVSWCEGVPVPLKMKVGAVRQSILVRVLCFVCVCVWLMCGSALFEPCGAAFCRVAPLQSSDSSSPSRFFSEYFPPAETGAVSCFSFSVQAAAGAIAARAHGLEAVLGGRRRRP